MTNPQTVKITDIAPDFPGLVWAYRFPAADQRAVELAPSPAGIAPLLEGDGFVWLHFALPDVRLEQQIKETAIIPPEVASVLMDRDRHLFLSVKPLALAGVMPDFRRELDDELKDIDRFRFALTSKFLITTRTNPLNSTAKLRAEVANGRMFGSSVELFSALSDAFEMTIEAFVDRLTEEIDSIEESVFRGHHSQTRGRIGNVRMDIAQVHRTLRTLVRLYQRLDASEQSDIPGPIRAALERREHHTAALDQDVVLLQERARLLQEEVNSRRQDEMNRSLFILSVATVIFLPPTLITGFFGMNTKDMFFAAFDNGTTYALILIVVAAAVAWWLLRRTGLNRLSD